MILDNESAMLSHKDSVADSFFDSTKVKAISAVSSGSLMGKKIQEYCGEQKGHRSKIVNPRQILNSAGFMISHQQINVQD